MRKEGGFTLAEVLIGLTILAIGILAITAIQVLSIKGTSFSNHLSHASMMAQGRLEHLKSLELKSEKLNTGDYEDIQTGIFHGGYRAERTDDYVVLHYYVSWAEGSTPHRISFSTVKGR